MKKKIVITSIVVAIILIGAGIWLYFKSFHNITFNVEPDGVSVAIYDGNSIITTMESGETQISIQNGEYYYVIDDEKYSGNEYDFNIDNSTKTVNIDPDYSSQYLSTLLELEVNNIESIINKKYSSLIKNYSITNETMFAKGEWFGATLEKNIAESDIADPYRIILNKVAGVWKIVHYPEIVLTSSNFSEVPIEILTAINNFDTH